MTADESRAICAELSGIQRALTTLADRQASVEKIVDGIRKDASDSRERLVRVETRLDEDRAARDRESRVQQWRGSTGVSYAIAAFAFATILAMVGIAVWG
ncbi:MAG: hypothetical protein AB7R89_16160 [Dehalococcoidia bacterium]